TYLILPANVKRPSPARPPILSTSTDTTASSGKTREKLQPIKGLTKSKDSLQTGRRNTPPVNVPLPGKEELNTRRTAAANSSVINLLEDVSERDIAYLGEYKVKSKAYFHDLPNGSTRRSAFIIHWNNATLQPLEDKKGYVYVIFKNHLGQTSKGWLNKNDLRKLE
ncbi:MAG: hypothetical protein WKF89_06680, partial [Chitinophagaceae bacterium]